MGRCTWTPAQATGLIVRAVGRFLESEFSTRCVAGAKMGGAEARALAESEHRSAVGGGEAEGEAFLLSACGEQLKGLVAGQCVCPGKEHGAVVAEERCDRAQPAGGGRAADPEAVERAGAGTEQTPGESGDEAAFEEADKAVSSGKAREGATYETEHGPAACVVARDGGGTELRVAYACSAIAVDLDYQLDVE